MASPLLRRSLLLPPAIRSSIYQSSLPHLRRHASTVTTHEIPTAASDLATAPAINPVAESLMAIPSLLLDTLHATGLPWYAVLPLTALIVRGGLVYNFSTLPARRRAILRRSLDPIVGAQMRRTITQRTNEKKPTFTPMLYFSTMIAMSRDFKLPLFNVRLLLNFGVLIAMTEAVRVKCGGREGVLSLITKPLTWLFSRKYPSVTADSETVKMETLSPDEILAQRLFDAREAKAQAAGLSPGDIPIETVHLEKLNTNPYAAYIEPSMRTEGLSFIPDLTLPDPTFTLPCLLTLTMAAGILLRRQAPLTTPEAPAPDAKKQPLTNDQRLGLSMSLLFGLGATQFPAAVLLYLVPNMAIAWLQGRWLDIKYPIPGTVEPCRKRVRAKIRKEFDMPIQW